MSGRSGPLAGRTALVSGASNGIGKATALRLAADGARVVLVARTAEPLDAVATEIGAAGGSAVAVPGDLATAAGTAQAVADVARLAGPVDILVNVAGAAPGGTILEVDDAGWATAIDLKLLGYIRLTRALLPGMIERGWGRIVNVAGNAGRQPDGWLVTAGVVNAAVIALTRAVAGDVARHGVTVNCICPGPTDTRRWSGLRATYAKRNGLDEETATRDLLGLIPAGKIATAEEIAAAIGFFASPDAGHIVGQALVVDGGQVRGA